MSVPLALLAYAALVGTAGPAWLRRSRWVRGSPRLGILAWQACTGAVLGSLVLLALAAAVPVGRVSFDLGHLLHACSAVLRGRYGFTSTAWASVLAGAAAVAVSGLLARALVWHTVALLRERSRHRLMLDVLGRPDPDGGPRVVEHDVPLAYCVPGQGGRIVVTSAAVAVLDAEQLLAVVAHEQAHLRGRHDLVLFASEVAYAAVPWLPVFRSARQETAGLVEMLADDRAARQVGALPLAAALVGLGTRAAPRSALGATTQLAPERVLRLVRTPYSTSAWRRAGVPVMSAVILLAPWAIAVAPAWTARGGFCPVG